MVFHNDQNRFWYSFTISWRVLFWHFFTCILSEPKKKTMSAGLWNDKLWTSHLPISGDLGILFHSLINLAICEGLCSTGGGWNLGPGAITVMASIQWRFAPSTTGTGFREYQIRLPYTGKSGENPCRVCLWKRRMHLKSPTFMRQGVWRVVMEYVFQLPSLKLTVRTWKWMVGRWHFLLGWPIFRCYVSFRECMEFCFY